MHWAGQAAHQLTVDLARRTHQSPSRLVDEDGLRGLPLDLTVDRSGAEQRGGLPSVGACSLPGTASLSTKAGWLASCLSSPSLVSSSLIADKTVRDDGVTHRSIETFG